MKHAIARYIGFKNNEGLPSFQRRELSHDYKKNIELAFKILVQSLQNNRYDLDNLRVNDLNAEIVGKIYDFIMQLGLSDRSINKYLSYYTSCINWYKDEYEVSFKNWFEKIKRHQLNPKPESISKSEHERLMEQITPEKGIREYENGVKHMRNFYRSWLADGFRLALETGRRREEIINLKFKDIIEENGIPIYIIYEDIKVNNIQNRKTEKNKKYGYIPITNNLHKLLLKLGYEENKGQDKYILAPEVEINRKRVMSDVLSRGFSHYYKQLNTGRELTFKSYRKAYITSLSIYLIQSEVVRKFTGHSDSAVIEKHYLDKKEMAKSLRNFEVFPKEIERKIELDEIRKEQNIDQKSIEK